ncbi:hypothetical protein [Pedobacter jejuensis]|uniref:Uncharacterized protein n=1 Tax=Pedobacter jejuensis TaxID=1268550 RepID=A0A3N0BUS2_9SPHI|nr:hypothetical protein [Pedobacter jejuensis]RNL53138.1 hypothetical protein D7004_10555 [Pedobacter jejuensis]
MELPVKVIEMQENERNKFLAAYFPGKQVGLEESHGALSISLDWYRDPSFYIDDQLIENLALLDKEMDCYGIPEYRKSYDGYNLVLNDNWTLYYWANVLKHRPALSGNLDKLVIIHIDDHYDCMPPLLFKNGKDTFLDPVTGTSVKMNDPESVITAIKSGSIAIGSFITPFLHHLSSVDFRYLIPESRNATEVEKGNISVTEVADTLFDGKLRPLLEFETKGKVSARHYRLSTDLIRILSDIPKDAVVLIHIDMDYFNNRFDGDSDWADHVKKHDPGAKIVHSQIETVLKTLKRDVDFERVMDFTIALSPGFFPSEYWADSFTLFNKYLLRK